MKKDQFFGGIVLLFATILIILTGDSSLSFPVAITLLVVGIALVAGSRRKAL